MRANTLFSAKENCRKDSKRKLSSLKFLSQSFSCVGPFPTLERERERERERRAREIKNDDTDTCTMTDVEIRGLLCIRATHEWACVVKVIVNMSID